MILGDLGDDVIRAEAPEGYLTRTALRFNWRSDAVSPRSRKRGTQPVRVPTAEYVSRHLSVPHARSTCSNSTFSPSETVGCVKIASRSTVYGSRPSIAVC